MNNMKSRNMIKELLVSLINIDKEIYSLSHLLANNKNVYRFVVEPNEIIPYAKIIDALDIKDEKKCQQLYDRLYKITMSNNDVYEEVEKFMDQYDL